MLRRVLIIFAFTVVCSSVAFAGGFGFQVDYNKFENADSGDFGIGARGEFGGSLSLILSFDYYFVGENIDNFKFYELNANLAYTFPTVGIRPYIGAGVGLGRISFDTNFFSDSATETGFNILGGVKFGGVIVTPFIELRGTFYGKDDTFANRVVFTGGILF